MIKEYKIVGEEEDKQKAVRQYVDIDKHDNSFISRQDWSIFRLHVFKPLIPPFQDSQFLIS